MKRYKIKLKLCPTVVVESISRIARNTQNLLSIVSELTEKGVEFVSLKETSTPPRGVSGV